MIYSVSFYSNNYAAKHLRHKSDAHLIMISNKEVTTIPDTEFLSVTQLTFLDDVYSNAYEDTISPQQAMEIAKTLKAIDDGPELLEVVITCDTGKTCSAAVAFFVASEYPRAKFFQKLDKNMLNQEVLVNLKQTRYKALRKPLSTTIYETLEHIDTKLHNLLVTISQRSIKQNITALTQYLRSEF